jgi:hypothetical protein
MKNIYNRAIENLNDTIRTTPVELVVANETYKGNAQEMLYKAVELYFENTKTESITIKTMLYTYTFTEQGDSKVANY